MNLYFKPFVSSLTGLIIGIILQRYYAALNESVDQMRWLAAAQMHARSGNYHGALISAYHLLALEPKDYATLDLIGDVYHCVGARELASQNYKLAASFATGGAQKVFEQKATATLRGEQPMLSIACSPAK